MSQKQPHLFVIGLGARCALLFALLFVVGLVGCDSSTSGKGPRYADRALSAEAPAMRFAVHPLYNPQKLAQAYQPLIDRLNQPPGDVRFALEASRDYATYEGKLRKREPEFLLANPWQALVAMQVGYTVIAMAGEPADFKGLIIIRKDSRIRQIADLRGKQISYPSPTALAACMMPQLYMQNHGIDVMRDTINRYVGSQESSIMNVYLGQTAAGATWPPPWRAFQKDHPLQAAELMVAWETEPMVNNAVMVRDDVAPAISARVRAILLGLTDSAEGTSILSNMETKRFLLANDDDYVPVRKFVQEFERKVRKVENRR